MFRSWDLAATLDDGDWTVGIKYAKHRERREFYIMDIVRKRLGSDGVEKLIQQTTLDDANSRYPVEAIKIEQEPGSAGKSLANHYKKTVLPGWPVDFKTATGKLPVRASPFLAAVEAGAVKIVPAPWNEDFKLELNRFPIGDYDDQIAAAAQAHNGLATSGGGVTWGNDSTGPEPIGLVRGNSSPQVLTGLTF